MNVVLGPAPCRECGASVYFNGRDWLEPRPRGRGWVHDCPQATTTNPWQRDRMYNIRRHRAERAR
jgi:hypothetical protein